VEIHKPKPWHGWREFLKEIGIVVIGVLIALAGEQFVELLHRGEQARLAERAMRLELAEDDGPQAFGRAVIFPCLDRQLAAIHDGAAAAPANQLRSWVAGYAPPVRTWDTEAWKVVVSSDVGNFMGAERLVDWSAAYRGVPRMNDMNLRESELAAQLRDALPPQGEPSVSDRQTLARIAGQLRFWNIGMARGSELFLIRIQSLGASVPIRTQQTLLAQARSLFGDCAVAPNLRAPGAGNPVANLRGQFQ
jgi:hypothetical protein